MKRIKFLLVFVFLLVGTLTVLAYSSGRYRQSAMFIECIRYNGVQPATPFSILDSTNWSSLFGNPSFYCFDGFDLCAICFDNLNTTPQRARQLLSDYYWNHGTLPQHGEVIVGPFGEAVFVYLKPEIP